MCAWSLILGTAGLISLYLAGSKSIWAWIVGLGTQGLWVTYALVTTQPGFVLSAAAFISVYIRNLYLWTRPPAITVDR